jgi:hypothetical protein
MLGTTPDQALHEADPEQQVAQVALEDDPRTGQAQRGHTRVLCPIAEAAFALARASVDVGAPGADRTPGFGDLKLWV